MSTIIKYLPWLLLAIFAAFFGFKSCRKQPEPVTPAQSEATRQQIEADNRTAEALHRQQAEFEKSILKAIDERLTAQAIQDKAATEKALQSALKHAQQPTLENCSHALTDCQHENQAKAAVIGTQSEKISSLSRTVKQDSSELNRQRMVIGLLNENLKQSNELWQQSETELIKAKRPKRVGIGLNLGYGISNSGLTPFVGVGISYNLIRL
jgi:hypothetical protein